MSVSATVCVTIGVSDLQAGLRLFRDTMGFREEWSGPASPSLLAAWRQPTGSRADIVELSANGYPVGRIRLASFSTPGSRVRNDHGPGATDTPLDVGPKAIDFYVRDPIDNAYQALCAAGLKPRSAPKRHIIGTSDSEEVVFSGPEGLPMLIMVGHKHRANSMRAGTPEGMFSELATNSVVAGDLEASRRFYGEALGLFAANDAETGDQYRELVCQLVGAPSGTRVHFLLYAAEGEPSGKILLVHFFDRTGKRLKDRMRPGNLGFSMFTHHTKDLDALRQAIESAGGEIVTPPQETELPSGRRRIMLARGPNEEMFEFVEDR